ncbi:MAG: hypothetical protein A2Y77_13220 [Planctomycetes bacterium RBG_13_62_9]|nr:MAG: hypothetical protein A2Y77_13220 [Planctomycetes bacterium RBG_13_62_9]
MTLSDQQKQLLFDFSLGLASDREIAEAEALLSWNEEAIELHQTFQVAIAPLDTVEMDPCPDELTEELFERLKEARQGSPDSNRLGELLAAEKSRARTIKIPLWRNWSEVATAAAAVILIVSVLFPSVGFMRQKSAQARCRSQLRSIYDGFRHYVSDHDGMMPAVAMMPGSPWWKVGYQGEENYSNTRAGWLLVKHGYVEPGQYLCPGRRETRKLSYDGFKIQKLNDFPTRLYIHFSIRIASPTSNDRDLTQKRVLMADRNPLSEQLPSDLSQLCSLELCEKLMNSNSPNHGNQGQNVLLDDGSVEFRKERHASISEDDIYIIQGMSSGTEVHGCEFPASDSDFFVAP